jgi:PAS domain S-box-containing protein
MNTEKKHQDVKEVTEAKIKHLNLLLASCPAVIYTCEPVGDYPATYVSEYIIEMLGYQPADFLKDPNFWADHIHPKDKNRVFDEVNNLFLKDRYLCEYRFQHKNGSYRWMRDEMKLIRDTSGNPIEIIGSWVDISSRKEAEQALERSEERYRLFVQNFHGIAYQGTLNFTPIFFHGAVAEITGYTEDEFIAGNPTWDQLILPADLDAAFADGEKMQKLSNYSYEREYRILSKDGQIKWVHEFAKNICNESGQPEFIEGVIYDVSDRKKIEEEKGQVIEELQKALAKVKQLSGFLPICASCKKIRDDKGYWKQIESYIRDHSEAEFSHSICPKCAEKLYPEINLDKK